MFAILPSAALSLQLLFASISVQSYICQPPDTPVINTPANESTISSDSAVLVAGTATPSTTVVLTDNGQTFATVTADQNKNFTVLATFTSGTHTLGIATSNPCGNSTGSPITITVEEEAEEVSSPGQPPDPSPSLLHEVLSDKPSPRQSTPTQNVAAESRPSGEEDAQPHESEKELILRNIYPEDGRVTTNASVYVTGEVNLPAMVQIVVNGKLRATTKKVQSSFGMSVPLSIGTNTITITATAGRAQAASTLTVIRREPVVQADVPWYGTTPGKIVILSAALISMLLILTVVRLR